ncbi:MAG: protein kinase, partial [Deltaproteobacteria bacterium]|nr:protein kinase [Kofleriaceae bacterium]
GPELAPRAEDRQQHRDRHGVARQVPGEEDVVDGEVRLGAGAMGVVFEARDTELDRRVAVKLVSPRSGDAETARSRLRREAQAMARLSHPNVAAVLDIGRVGDQLFIAMELVRGRTLRAFVDEARPWKETLPILLAAARGLAAAHAAGVVHRDFKPDNVLVRDDGAVRVSDFGLAREATGRVDTTGSGDVPLELVTATGAVVGTPAYLAPESVRGEADAASDQFAFAVTAFEVLEGRRPFESADIVEMLRGERSTPPRRPWRRRDLPAALRAVIERGLATDPSARWPSMAAMAAQLERLAQPRMKRRIAVLVAAIGVVSLGAVLVATRPGSGSGPRQERFWKEKLLTFRGDVHQAALSPDGTLIAAQAGGELVIIPVRGGEHRRLASLLGDDQQSSLVAELEWSPDGSTLLMSQVRPGARPQWSTIDVASGAVEHLSLEGGEGAMLSNDEIVISASNYRAVTVVSRRDNRPLRTCQVPGDYQWISDLAVAAGSVFIVVGWSDQTSALLAMDPTCGRSRVVIRRGPPRFFIPSSDGRLFSVPVGRIIDRYTEHRADGEPVGPARPLPVGTVALAGVLPDGSAVVARQATTWRMLDSNGRELGRGTGTPDFVLSPDRRQFAVLDRRPGESPTLFVVDRGEVGIPKAPIAEQVEAVAWSPTGSHLAVIARDSERAVLWVVDRSTGDRHALPAAQLSTQPGTGVQWLDDDRIAYLRADHATYLWVDRRTGETGQLLDATLGWTFKLARAPRGDALALFWMRGRDAGTYLVPGDGPPEVVRAAGQFEDGHAWDDDGQLWLFSAASIDRYDPRTRETSHVREFDLESTSRLLGVFPLGGVDFHALVSNATVDLLLYAPQ